MAKPCPASEAAAEILVINPERLPEKAVEKPLMPERDLFNWPAEQRISLQARAAEALRVDPFAGLSLDGIIWDKNQPLAIINDTLVGLGESISGSLVKAIKRDEVILENKNATHTLQFKNTFIDLNLTTKDN